MSWGWRKLRIGAPAVAMLTGCGSSGVTPHGVQDGGSGFDASTSADAGADGSADDSNATSDSCWTDAGFCLAPAISAGDDFTCALLASGNVECWGSDYYGNLGEGTKSLTVPAPSPVAVGGLSGVAAVSARFTHACALRASGEVVCWGENQWGQIGNGSTFDALSPSRVPNLLASAVASGNVFSCALGAGGTVWCWGLNDAGLLGVVTPPVDAGRPTATLPLQVPGVTGAHAIAAGAGHVCVLLAGGTVECWGYNDSGQLGDGTTTNSATPVTVAGLTGATAVAASSIGTCAIVASGDVACWGGDVAGTLGTPSSDGGAGTDGGASNVLQHVALSGPARAISLGANHACALLVDGTVACWGQNLSGQLGDGTSTSSASPVAVGGVTGAIAVAAGGRHSCALLHDGAATCWGANGSGQLGVGTVLDSPTPMGVTCHGGACGPCTPACGACSAQCTTPACCGASCQTTHSNGHGVPYFDCAPLGTYDRAEAYAACVAAAGSSPCHDLMLSCADGGTASAICQCGVGYCWVYAGPGAGSVFDNGVSSYVACPTMCPTSAGKAWN